MWLNRALFGISPAEASFARRGFQETTPAKRAHLEHIGRTFIAGYLQALEASDVEALARPLNAVDAEFRGFAFEGAAMSLALMDQVWRRRTPRFEKFLRGPAAMHRYMLYVGYGWAVARLLWLRRDVERVRRRHDEYLGWLIPDGYGFHEGYFYPRSAVIEMKQPHGVRGYETRVFDQGLGRSLWFVNGADVERVAACIGGFASERQPDLWSGIGLAATYAGGAGEDELSALLRSGEQYRSHLAQGAAFAAKARYSAGIATPHTESACRVLCGMTGFAAAALTDAALEAVQRGGPTGQPYEAWRAEIRAQFENHHKICAIVGK